MQNDSRDCLVAKWQGIIFQRLTPLTPKKFMLEKLQSKRLNVVIMTIMFHRWDKHRRNSNVSKVIS